MAFLWLLWIKDEKELWGRPSSCLVPVHQFTSSPVPVHLVKGASALGHQCTSSSSSAVHQYTSAVALHQVNPWLNWPPGRPSCCNNFNRCNNFDSCNNFSSFNNVKKSSYFGNLKCHVFYFHDSKIMHGYESVEEWVKAKRLNTEKKISQIQNNFTVNIFPWNFKNIWWSWKATITSIPTSFIK